MADGIFSFFRDKKKGRTYEVADAFARAAIENLNALKIEFVQALPTTDIDTRTIYFVPAQDPATENYYEEYINTDGTTSGWELIGSTQVDLSQYYTKTETDTLLSSKADTSSLASVATSGDYTDLQNTPSIPSDADDITYDNTTSGLNATNAQDAIDETVAALGDKVDKVSGKGLSSNDYTTAEKNKLSGIATGAEVNVQADWNQTDNTADDYIKNKPTIPSGGGTAASTSYDNTQSGLQASNVQDALDELTGDLGDKVDKVQGKGLSTEDFTTAEKNKLTGIATGAEVNVQSDWSQSDNSADDFIKNKPSIPSKTSDLTNDSGFVTSSQLADKMDKVDPTGSGSFSLNRKANTTVGFNSTAEGTDATASGSDSHAEGHETTASGSYTHAEGSGTTASYNGAHAEGNDTTASAQSAHAEGTQTEASATDAHAEGHGTIAASKYQHAGGRYNIADNANTYAEIIGNGYANNRSNARTLDWQGNETISGDLYFNGGAQSLSSQLADKANSSALAAVATSGDYGDLQNTPTIPAAQVNSDWNASSGVEKILNKPTLAAVATSGDYGDLSNKPTIPAAQVNSDWNASSGVSEILNKPSFKTINGTSILGSGNITTPDTKPSNFVAPTLPSLAGTDYAETGWTSGGVAVNHATNKSVGSIQFPKGIWLVKLSVGFYANGTGMRAIGFSMTKNENNYTVILPPHTQAGNQTKLADFFIVNANEGDRYFIQAYQTNSVSGAMYVYPTYSAIKLS